MMRINFEEPDDRQDEHDEPLEASHEPSQTSDIYNARKAAKNLFSEDSEDDADDFESYEGEDFSKRYSTPKHSMREIDDDRPMAQDARMEVSEFRIPPSPSRDREKDRRRGFDEGRRVPKSRTAVTGPIPSVKDYIFTEDNDDEFTNFRRRYEKKSAAPKYHEDEHYERPARRTRRKVANPEHMNDDELDDQGVEPYVQSGISAPIRGIATVLVSLFLMMMVFLIYRHNMMSRELAAAELRAARVPSLNEELSGYRLRVEQLEETILQQGALISPPIPPNVSDNDTAVNGYGQNGETVYDSNGYATNGAATNGATTNGNGANGNTAGQETPVTPDPPPAPDPPPPPQQRIHVVVQGDTLASLAQRFYNSQTQANIQRIMDANNITDPNLISIGQRLVIP